MVNFLLREFYFHIRKWRASEGDRCTLHGLLSCVVLLLFPPLARHPSTSSWRPTGTEQLVLTPHLWEGRGSTRRLQRQKPRDSRYKWYRKTARSRMSEKVDSDMTTSRNEGCQLCRAVWHLGWVRSCLCSQEAGEAFSPEGCEPQAGSRDKSGGYSRYSDWQEAGKGSQKHPKYSGSFYHTRMLCGKA